MAESGRRLAVFLAPLAILAVAFASRADAFVYWSNEGGGIGRANLNGSDVRPKFIGAGRTCGVAVDGEHIYWNDVTSIGRANLDGSGVNRSFITPRSLVTCGIAITSSHVYWAAGPAIGRANLDGTGVDREFIPRERAGSYPCGMAVDGTYLYWGTGPSDKIGRAKLDGSEANPAFISGHASNPCGIAVDDTRIYWTSRSNPNRPSGHIGRAKLDGSGADGNYFVAGIPCGASLVGDRIYYADQQPRFEAIHRAKVDKSGEFLTITKDVAKPCGVAVDSRASHASDLRFGKVRHNRARGTAKLNVHVDGSGELALRGTKKVKGDKVEVRQKKAGKVRLAIRPRGRTKRGLKRDGTVRVKARVTYTAEGGGSTSKTRRLRLIKG